MNLEELLNTTPEELAKLQFKELKSAAIATLQKVIDQLERDRFDLVATGFSPAGDGMGEDNSYISFKHIHPKLEDIGDVLEILESLQSTIGKGSK